MSHFSTKNKNVKGQIGCSEYSKQGSSRSMILLRGIQSKSSNTYPHHKSLSAGKQHHNPHGLLERIFEFTVPQKEGQLTDGIWRDDLCTLRISRNVNLVWNYGRAVLDSMWINN